MKKVALLLLSTVFTFGAFAQKKKEAPKADTVDVSNVKVIKAGDKYYQVVYLKQTNVVYLQSPDQTIVIYKILNDGVQSDFPSSVVEPIKQILLQQIPKPAK